MKIGLRTTIATHFSCCFAPRMGGVVCSLINYRITGRASKWAGEEAWPCEALMSQDTRDELAKGTIEMDDALPGHHRGERQKPASGRLYGEQAKRHGISVDGRPETSERQWTERQQSEVAKPSQS